MHYASFACSSSDWLYSQYLTEPHYHARARQCLCIKLYCICTHWLFVQTYAWWPAVVSATQQRHMWLPTKVYFTEPFLVSTEIITSFYHTPFFIAPLLFIVIAYPWVFACIHAACTEQKRVQDPQGLELLLVVNHLSSAVSEAWLHWKRSQCY